MKGWTQARLVQPRQVNIYHRCCKGEEGGLKDCLSQKSLQCLCQGTPRRTDWQYNANENITLAISYLKLLSFIFLIHHRRSSNRSTKKGASTDGTHFHTALALCVQHRSEKRCQMNEVGYDWLVPVLTGRTQWELHKSRRPPEHCVTPSCSFTVGHTRDGFDAVSSPRAGPYRIDAEARHNARSITALRREIENTIGAATNN